MPPLPRGESWQKKFYGAREISFKGYRDIVTDADFAADHAARQILQRAFPTYAVLSEEDAAPPARAEYIWIMDPLDGTSNYARNIPIFCVSLALTRRGQPLVGVVFDPMRRECFFAERGRGAYLNGQRIHASRVSALPDAIVSDRARANPNSANLGLKMFSHFASQSQTARVGGSAALSLCYIGAGRFDTYMQLTLAPWDVAAGILILREGGAHVTDLQGKPATIQGGTYLAGAPKIFPEFFRQIQTLL